MSRSGVVIRPAGPGDRRVVEDALLWAVNWSPDRVPFPPDVVLNRADLARYVAGWPVAGDVGVVADAGGSHAGSGSGSDADADADRTAIGAAWLRYLPADEPGYGFVAGDVPELSIGVHPAHRGRGIGRRLLRALLEAARREGVVRVSLSVERTNPARALYVSEGFEVVGGSGSADTMVLEFPAPPC